MAESHLIHSHLTYLEGSSENGHALDLFEPEKTDSSSTRSPLVIYIHGGGWTERDKKGTHMSLLEYLQPQFMLISLVQALCRPLNLTRSFPPIYRL